MLNFPTLESGFVPTCRTALDLVMSFSSAVRNLAFSGESGMKKATARHGDYRKTFNEEQETPVGSLCMAAGVSKGQSTGERRCQRSRRGEDAASKSNFVTQIEKSQEVNDARPLVWD